MFLSLADLTVRRQLGLPRRHAPVWKHTGAVGRPVGWGLVPVLSG